MSTFFLTLELNASFNSANPLLNIFLDGEMVTSSTISKKVGTGYASLTFEISGSAESINSLNFQFQDNLNETDRSINIRSVQINNQPVLTNMLLPGGGVSQNPAGDFVIGKGQNLAVDTAAVDFLFGVDEPTLADLGTVTITGTGASEAISGLKVADVIDGGAGHDDIRGGLGDDRIYGGAGNDQIFGNAGNDLLVGGAGNDALFGREDNDLIYGGLGDDRLHGDGGNDVLSGNAGVDRLYGGAGNDIINGGDDNDIIYGDDGDDIIGGDDGHDVIRSGLGNDVLNGGVGNDRLISEGGGNTLNGGLGNDSLFADNDDATDTLNGGEGNDLVTGGVGDDVLNGGDGNDRIEGKDGDDEINGGDGSDKIFAQDGNDTIYGGDGVRDDIYGGNGNDIVYGEGGVDKIFGDNGRDTLNGGDGNDVIRGGTGADTLNGDAGNDRLFGEDGADTINGGDGDDFIRGLASADIIDGGAGDDTIIHDDNFDTIDGGADYDILHLAGTNSNDIDVTGGDLNAVNIEQIALNNFNGIALANTLTLSVSDISSLSGSDTLYITGDVGSDSVVVNNLDIVNDLIGGVVIDTVNYTHYLNGGNNLYIQTGLTVLTNSAPIANDDDFNGTEGSNINGNVLNDNGNGADNDPVGNLLSVVADVITTAGGGTVTLLGTGSFTYVPETNFDGVDSFSYTLQNSLGETDTGLVTLNVAGVNDGPIARDDEFSVTKNLAFSGDLHEDNGNGVDSDIETALEDLQVQAETITTANGANVVINADGTFTYTPASGFIGPDSFSYTLVDGDGGTNTGDVSVLVSDANSLPGGDVTLSNNGGVGNLSNSEGVNTADVYDNKTTVIRFETGSDVTTRQVIYEQGGGTRGLNVYIENGQLHMAVWNFAEEDWGYKEVTTNISAGQTYTSAMVFEGVLPANGTLTGYLDGNSFDVETGVGLLYGHSGGIGLGQTNGSTVINGSNNTDINTFLGKVDGVVQYNEALSLEDLAQVETVLSTPSAIFVIEDVMQETVPNNPVINDGGPYSEKTMAVAFVTGSDVTTRQMIYEQGGTVRGLSIFIEGGMLYVAAWNYAEENWGYKEVSTAITADTFFTSTLILDGTLAETGTLTGYLDGVSFGQETGVGLLYNHPGAIGVGELVNGTVFHGVADGGNGFAFGGSIERLAQYNDVLDGAFLIDLHSTMAGENPNVTGNTFVGDENDNTLGGGNGDDNIQARGGNDRVSGNGGNDILRGEDGNDTLFGNAGNDFLYGDDGSDILVGGSGLDVMFGGAGADIFGFVEIDGNIDQVRDFVLGGANQDRINLSNLLTGYEDGVSDISDYVLVNVVGTNRADILVDTNGDGSGFEIIALIRGSDFTGNTAQDLLDNGALIVDQSII